MAEWSSYSLSDLVLFSLQAYFGVFELLNTTFWPAHLVILAVGLSIGFFIMKGTPANRRIIWSVLGLLWIWTGWSFVFAEYSAINWAAAYIAPAFWLQGLLFGLFAVASQPPGIWYSGTAASRAAIVLYLFAVIGYPAVTLALGRPQASVEFLGISADPGVAATLAILALSRGSFIWLAWIAPIAWCGLTGLTLWVLGSSEFFIAPLAAAVAVAATIYSRRTPQLSQPG